MCPPPDPSVGGRRCGSAWELSPLFLCRKEIQDFRAEAVCTLGGEALCLLFQSLFMQFRVQFPVTHLPQLKN